MLDILFGWPLSICYNYREKKDFYGKHTDC
ncbi:MAG: hypothetical protein JWO41_731 [Candidatus Saccharibacteria bacterium]|nr:hypothetical protein [Candidatus Saccharibacteria bacterium]